MGEIRSYPPVELARCQSVDRNLGRAMWRAGRDFVHLPYVRAVVAGVCIVAILGSAVALALAIRHDVSAAAVYRYFTRPHFEQADLSRQLRSGTTALGLEPLLLLPPGVNTGGLLYAEEHGLVFYVHESRKRPGAERARVERRELFDRLMPLYWRADLGGLARELSRPTARQQLIARGAEIQDLYLFQKYSGQRVDARARTRMLRAAVRQIQLIAPYIPEPFELDFAEELRFYDGHRPEGEFAGLWEVATPNPFGMLDVAFAHEMSRSHHYLVIWSHAGRTLVSDFFQGQRKDFLVRSMSHPSGRTLYRLTAQPAS